MPNFCLYASSPDFLYRTHYDEFKGRINKYRSSNLILTHLTFIALISQQISEVSDLLATKIPKTED